MGAEFLAVGPSYFFSISIASGLYVELMGKKVKVYELDCFSQEGTGWRSVITPLKYSDNQKYLAAGRSPRQL